MCLILIAHKVDAALPLIVAANRDEFHARPAQHAGWWADEKDTLGGRDLQAGGTWLAVQRNGRFAAVTNYRDADSPPRSKRSRGFLVTEFLQSDATPLEYVDAINDADYAGFNILVADGDTLAYHSNRSDEHGELAPGIYGLGNATLDTPWAKVERSKEKLRTLVSTASINATSLLSLLADREKAPVDEVQSERLPFATAHAITAPFIVLPEYGTRCSTVVTASATGKWSFLERRFSASGESTGDSQYSFNAVDAQ